MAQNFPFWQTLSEEAKTAYLIAERMLQNNETFAQASKFLDEKGVSWSAQRLANGLSKVAQAMQQTGVQSQEITQVLEHGTTAATEAMEAAALAEQGIVQRTLSAVGRAVYTAVREILKRIGIPVGEEMLGAMGATFLGAAALTVVLGLLAWDLSSYLGSRSGDQPIQLGSRASSPASTPVSPPSAHGAGPYYIYVLDIEPGGSIYIGGSTDVQRPSCQFTDGGTCGTNDPNVRVLKTIGGPYESYDQAVAAYCGMLTETHSAFGGTKGTVGGNLYWLDNAPACPSH